MQKVWLLSLFFVAVACGDSESSRRALPPGGTPGARGVSEITAGMFDRLIRDINADKEYVIPEINDTLSYHVVLNTPENVKFALNKGTADEFECEFRYTTIKNMERIIDVTGDEYQVSVTKNFLYSTFVAPTDDIVKKALCLNLKDSGLQKVEVQAKTFTSQVAEYNNGLINRIQDLISHCRENGMTTWGPCQGLTYEIYKRFRQGTYPHYELKVVLSTELNQVTFYEKFDINHLYFTLGGTLEQQGSFPTPGAEASENIKSIVLISDK